MGYMIQIRSKKDTRGMHDIPAFLRMVLKEEKEQGVCIKKRGMFQGESQYQYQYQYQYQSR